MHDGPRRRSCWAYTISERRCYRDLACPARGCTAGAGAGAPSESSLSAKLRSRRSRLDIRSWRMLLRKSGMPNRSMLGAKPKLMYNTSEAEPTESVSLLRTLR